MPGSTHYQLIEPLPPSVLLFAGDAPRSRATTCWRPVLGVAHCGCPPALDTTWNRRFSGGTKVPGVLEPVPRRQHLDPDGWLVRNLRTEYTRTRARNTATSRYGPSTNVRNHATPGGREGGREGQGEVSGVDKGPSNGWHLWRQMRLQKLNDFAIHVGMLRRPAAEARLPAPEHA